MFQKWLKLINKFLSIRVEIFGKEKLDNFEKNLEKNKENIKDNLGDFLQEEKKEVAELINGTQNFAKYRHNSISLFKDYFIPHDGNDNRPKILRPKQLTIMAIMLLLLKVSLVGYLFTVYQQEARMSETTISQILLLTNESRIAAGIQPVALNTALNKAAQVKAEDMVVNNYFSHTSPNGFKPWNFVPRSEYPYTLIGENLAMNFVAATDAHSALMASASHKKNILNSKYSDIGLAVISGQIDGQETNILVELFGAKMESSPAVVTEIASIKMEPVSTSSESEKATSLVEVAASVDTAPVIAQSEAPITPTKPVIVKADEEKIIVNKAIPKNTAESLIKPEVEPVIEAVVAPISVSEINTSSAPIIEEMPAIVATASAIMAAAEASSIVTDEPVYSLLAENKKINRAEQIMHIAKIVYLILLVFLIIALLINIFVRIAVQHKKVILQTLLLIVLVIALVMFDFNFLKNIPTANIMVIL